jgi:hypothetical protein
LRPGGFPFANLPVKGFFSGWKMKTLNRKERGKTREVREEFQTEALPNRGRGGAGGTLRIKVDNMIVSCCEWNPSGSSAGVFLPLVRFPHLG